MALAMPLPARAVAITNKAPVLNAVEPGGPVINILSGPNTLAEVKLLCFTTANKECCHSIVRWHGFSALSVY
jgi:hypothetical protein